MQKNVFGKRLQRDSNERKALFKSLMSSLVLREKITTTESKAKAIIGQVDKIVNRAKKDKENAYASLNPYLSSSAMKKLIVEIAPRFSAKTSGYTRLIRLGNRFSDNAKTVLMEWVERNEVTSSKFPTSLKLRGTSKVQSDDKKEEKIEEKKTSTKKEEAKETKTKKRTVKKEVKK